MVFRGTVRPSDARYLGNEKKTVWLKFVQLKFVQLKFVQLELLDRVRARSSTFRLRFSLPYVHHYNPLLITNQAIRSEFS